jgi:hypothetical protein
MLLLVLSREEAKLGKWWVLWSSFLGSYWKCFVGLRVQPFVGGLISGEDVFSFGENCRLYSLSFYFLSVVSKFQLLGR